MKKLIFLILIFSIGCEVAKTSFYAVDNAESERIFFKCLEQISKDSNDTQCNDQAEVVNECYAAARKMARKCIKNCIRKDY